MKRTNKLMAIVLSVIISLCYLTFFDGKIAFAGSSTELEPNDSVLTATDIDINTEVTGNTSFNDLDWFRFTIPQPGFVTINFKHGISSEAHLTWWVYLYEFDSSTGENRELTHIIPTVNALNMKSGNIGLPAGTYYIKVDGVDIGNFDYSVAALYKASNTSELEFNDTILTATPITMNCAYTGTIVEHDTDWFSFSLPTSGAVKLNVKHAAITSGKYMSWYIVLYSFDPSTGAQKDLTDFFATVNSLNVYSSSVGLPAGTYYVSVEGIDSENIDYSISANYTLSAPQSVKAVKIAPKSIKISWGKVNGAASYEIWRATSAKGSFTKIGSTASLSFTNNGLTGKKYYYYKVRALNNGSYSAFSAVVKAKG